MPDLPDGCHRVPYGLVRRGVRRLAAGARVLRASPFGARVARLHRVRHLLGAPPVHARPRLPAPVLRAVPLDR